MEVGALELVEVLRDVECGRIFFSFDKLWNVEEYFFLLISCGMWKNIRKGAEHFFGHVFYVAKKGLRI